MNELITNLEIKVQKGAIIYDLSPTKAQIAVLTELYGNWQVKEEDLAAAKDTAAALNKTSKKLSDGRIAAVKDFKQPIDQFEIEIKSACGTLESLSKSITDQIAAFDERTKEEKRTQIKSMALYADFIRFDERWLNKTFSLSDVLAAIKAQTLDYETNKQAVEMICQANGLSPDKYVQQLKCQPLAIVTANVANDKQVVDDQARRAAYVAPSPVSTKPVTPPESIEFGAPVNEETTAREYVAVGKAYKLDVLERYAADLGIQFVRRNK
jgi:hypothetical protein